MWIKALVPHMSLESSRGFGPGSAALAPAHVFFAGLVSRGKLWLRDAPGAVCARVAVRLMAASVFLSNGTLAESSLARQQT